MSLSIENSCGGKSLPELTSPATATEIEQGKEAIDANGNKIIGTLGKYASGSIFTTGNISESGGTLVVDVIYNKDKKIIENGNTFSYYQFLNSSTFGNATAADVTAGKTFTSAAGLKVPGTGNFLNIIEGTFDNSSASDVYTINIQCPALPKIVILQEADASTKIGILKFIYSNDFNFGSIRSNYLTGKPRDEFLTSVNKWNFSDGVFTLSVGTNKTDYKINKTYNYKIIY